MNAHGTTFRLPETLCRTRPSHQNHDFCAAGRSRPVEKSQITDADGYYQFDQLLPGTYSVTIIQPAGYSSGIETLGNLGGTVGDNQFTNIVLGPTDIGTGYNFGQLPGGSGTHTVYQNHHLVSLTDPVGNTTQFTYNSLGKVASMTDPLGHTATYNYNAQGKLESKTDRNDKRCAEPNCSRICCRIIGVWILGSRSPICRIVESFGEEVGQWFGKGSRICATNLATRCDDGSGGCRICATNLATWWDGPRSLPNSHGEFGSRRDEVVAKFGRRIWLCG